MEAVISLGHQCVSDCTFRIYYPIWLQFMDVNKNTFTRAALKLHDILKTKNDLVKSTYYVTEYTVCDFITFVRQRKKIVIGSYRTGKIRS